MNELRGIESQTKSLALMESLWVFKLGLIVLMYNILLTRQSHFVLHVLLQIFIVKCFNKSLLIRTLRGQRVNPGE